MIEIVRILCPIDFSDYSRRAFDHAVAMARWYDATITLLHVFSAVPVAAYAPGTPMHPSVVLTPSDREALLASMKRFAEDEAGPDLPVQCEACEGTAAAEILARARAMPSDLIVMGTHGRSGFERLVLGSVTERVLRKAACPVLSVPRHARDAVPAPPVLFKDILCAIDFSDCSINALNYAMSLAQEADARLTVLHVIELLPELPSGTKEAVQVWPQNVTEFIAEVEQDRRERLKAAVPESVRAYCAVETVLVHGTPYREILRVAAEQQSDLIVIGIHGRGAADLLFFGSTSQHVVRQAACPVLTLRRG
ncbi:MAG: universal stress protein [Acidobacteria bacterium]|nr:universal stress protein [Acidobacteriota bacterium]